MIFALLLAAGLAGFGETGQEQTDPPVTLPPDNTSFNPGFRLVQNAVTGSGNIASSTPGQNGRSGGGVLIAYFSWGGNIRGITEEIQLSVIRAAQKCGRCDRMAGTE